MESNRWAPAQQRSPSVSTVPAPVVSRDAKSCHQPVTSVATNTVVQLRKLGIHRQSTWYQPATNLLKCIERENLEVSWSKDTSSWSLQKASHLCCVNHIFLKIGRQRCKRRRLHRACHATFFKDLSATKPASHTIASSSISAQLLFLCFLDKCLAAIPGAKLGSCHFPIRFGSRSDGKWLPRMEMKRNCNGLRCEVSWSRHSVPFSGLASCNGPRNVLPCAGLWPEILSVATESLSFWNLWAVMVNP